jgi:hypothetical protein
MSVRVPSKLKPLLEPIDAVHVCSRNMRTGHSVAAIAASLTEFGWHAPLVARKNGDVLIGNGRLLAAIELGLEQVPVLRVTDSDAQAARRMFADNRTGELSIWDIPVLMDHHDTLVDLDDSYLLDQLYKWHDPADDKPPTDFPEVDESIETNRQCPKCKYRWSE